MRKLHILTLILKLNAHTYLQTYKILRTSHRSYLGLSKFKSKMNQNIYIPTIFYLISFSFKSKYLNLYDWWGIIIQLSLQISFGLIIKRNSNDKNWIVFQAGNDSWLEKKGKKLFWKNVNWHKFHWVNLIGSIATNDFRIRKSSAYSSFAKDDLDCFYCWLTQRTKLAIFH